MKPPSVGIIIPNHNGISHLKDLLPSLNNLNYPNFEVIIIDDASIDGSAVFIKKNYPWVKLIETMANVGPAEARNIGTSISKSKYVAFLDNDTKVDKNWLLELVQVAESDPKIGVCASKILFFHNPSIINSASGICDKFGGARNRGEHEKDFNQYEKVEEVPYGPTTAILIRKDVLNSVGGFDSTYFYNFEDVDLCWRIWLWGYRVVYVPSSKILHKKSSTMGKNVRRMFYLGERNRLKTLIKNYEIKTLIRIFLIFLGIRLIYFTASILQRRPYFILALVKALFWNLININQTLKTRAVIQMRRKIPDKQFFRLLFRGSLDLIDALQFLRKIRPSYIWGPVQS